MDQTEDTEEENITPIKRNPNSDHERESKQRNSHQTESPPSSEHGASCVSHRRAKSFDGLIDFKRSAAKIIHEPDPSCLSMKSDQSMEKPVVFKSDPKHKGQSVNLESLELSSDLPAQQHPAQSDSEFKVQELKESILTFVEEEFNMIQKLLSPDYQKDPELEVESEDQKNSKEALVKIAVHILQSKKQEQLAERLKRNFFLQVCGQKHKSALKKYCQKVFEQISKAKDPTLRNHIYTKHYITKETHINTEHEVIQIEKASRKTDKDEETIRHENIFNLKDDSDGPIRTVMTKGVAGIGKSILTQKFTLDWAEEKSNQDIQFLFPFTFRELNLLKEKKFSLVELIHLFFNETKKAEIHKSKDFQVIFIFDGLDECRLPLDFHHNEIITDITESTSVDVLLTNLISGRLFPSARLWITTRPATANKIPPEHVDMMTEVRGFTDEQKEKYFKTKIKGDEQAKKILSHIKKSRSLYIMCHIPVFCWITATVLEEVLETKELPSTLTEMYIHFLLFQTKQKKVKYDKESQTDPVWSQKNKKRVEALAKLAFDQLLKGNLIFYESDLEDCGINIRAASVDSGVFTQIFKAEKGIHQEKIFSFVHLSVQEFLAALHVHLTFIKHGVNLMEERSKHSQTSDLQSLHQWAVYQALQSPNGHLDLFLRFLLGLSLPSNQKLLQGLMAKTERTIQSNQETINYIKTRLNEDLSTEQIMNLFHCLKELNDRSLVEEIQQYLSLGSVSTEKPSPAQWSAQAFDLLTSGRDLDVFDLKKYSSSEEALLRLLPVVKASKKALLGNCTLSEEGCRRLSSVLSSHSSKLTELDVSVSGSGVKQLSDGLQSLNCKLNVLRLQCDGASEESCEVLSSVLGAQATCLKELHLSHNNLKDAGLKHLSDGIKSPNCQMETLWLNTCDLSEKSCRALSAVLSCQPSYLKELDLSNNNLGDSGLKYLSIGLSSLNCQLETLSLSGCLITEDGCTFLATALKSNSSQLKRLDMRYNHPRDSGVKELQDVLKEPIKLCLKFPLQGDNVLKKDYCFSGCTQLLGNDDTLQSDSTALNSCLFRFEPFGEKWLTPGLRKYSCELSINTNTVNNNLKLSNNNRKVTLVEENQTYPDHPDRFNWTQMLCENILTGRCYWEVEWTGNVCISVSYKEIKRRGKTNDCVFGRNDQSWSLNCSDQGFSVCHNNRVTQISSSSSNRVAVYVDCPAGTLSFYKVSSESLIHLHTFNTTFTQPLLPGFLFGVFGSSVDLY